MCVCVCGGGGVFLISGRLPCHADRYTQRPPCCSVPIQVQAYLKGGDAAAVSTPVGSAGGRVLPIMPASRSSTRMQFSQVSAGAGRPTSLSLRFAAYAGTAVVPSDMQKTVPPFRYLLPSAALMVALDRPEHPRPRASAVSGLSLMTPPLRACATAPVPHSPVVVVAVVETLRCHPSAPLRHPT
jgi:hypothetical protein